MDKPFQSYENLIVKLRDEKKLSIPDEAHVIALLKKHSYFSLVNISGSTTIMCLFGLRSKL